jgi:hypothetical protein
MDAYWKFLETHADRAEIQEEIRREIRKGTIRVIPGPRGIRIVPQVWDSAPDKQAILKINSLRDKLPRGSDG